MFFSSKPTLIGLVEKLGKEVDKCCHHNVDHGVQQAAINIAIEQIREFAYGLTLGDSIKERLKLILNQIILSAAAIPTFSATKEPVIKKIFALYGRLIESPIEEKVLSDARSMADDGSARIIDIEMKENIYHSTPEIFFKMNSETAENFRKILKAILLKENVKLTYNQKINQKTLEKITNHYIDVARNVYYEEKSKRVNVGTENRIDLFLSTLDEIERDEKNDFLKNALKNELKENFATSFLERLKMKDAKMKEINFCIQKAVNAYVVEYSTDPFFREKIVEELQSLKSECVDELLSEARGEYLKVVLKEVLSTHDLSSLQDISTELTNSIANSSFDSSETQSPIDMVIGDYIRDCKVDTGLGSDVVTRKLDMELRGKANEIVQLHIKELIPKKENNTVSPKR